MVVLADIRLTDLALYDRDVIEYREDNGETCTARWFDPVDLDCGGLELYPNGLKAALAEMSRPCHAT